MNSILILRDCMENSSLGKLRHQRFIVFLVVLRIEKTVDLNSAGEHVRKCDRENNSGGARSIQPIDVS